MPTSQTKSAPSIAQALPNISLKSCGSLYPRLAAKSAHLVGVALIAVLVSSCGGGGGGAGNSIPATAPTPVVISQPQSHTTSIGVTSEVMPTYLAGDIPAEISLAVNSTLSPAPQLSIEQAPTFITLSGNKIRIDLANLNSSHLGVYPIAVLAKDSNNIEHAKSQITINIAVKSLAADTVTLLNNQQAQFLNHGIILQAPPGTFVSGGAAVTIEQFTDADGRATRKFTLSEPNTQQISIIDLPIAVNSSKSIEGRRAAKTNLTEIVQGTCDPLKYQGSSLPLASDQCLESRFRAISSYSCFNSGSSSTASAFSTPAVHSSAQFLDVPPTQCLALGGKMTEHKDIDTYSLLAGPLLVDASTKPILLIHGFEPFGLGGGDGTWKDTPERLEAMQAISTKKRLVVYELRWNTNIRFQDAANDLIHAVNTIYKRHGGEPVTMIAHSFGGLLSRTALQGFSQSKARLDGIVDKLITVGTPHSGIAGESQKYYGTDFAAGSHNFGLNLCRQISCYQAGEIGSVSETIKLSEPEPGKIVVDIANLGTLPPTPFKAYSLIGLQTQTLSGSGIEYKSNSDGLISFAGQRFQLGSAFTSKPNGVNALDSTSQIEERVLGIRGARSVDLSFVTPYDSQILINSDIRHAAGWAGFVVGLAKFAEPTIECTSSVDCAHPTWLELRDILGLEVFAGTTVPPPVADSPPVTPLAFSSLTPQSLTTETAPYKPTLTVRGNNLLNLVKIEFNWTGASSGSFSWLKGDTNWVNQIKFYSDSTITIQPTTIFGLSEPIGTRNWTVKLTDSSGISKTQSFLVTYQTRTLLNVAPVLTQISPPVTTIAANQAYTLTFSAADTDGNLSNVDVNWNDGANSVVTQPANGGSGSFTFTRTFPTVGAVIHWSANAYDKDGLPSNKISGSITVTAAPPPTNTLPVAAFTLGATTAAVGVPVNFDASASADPDGSVVTYSWNFGDNSTGIGRTTSHTYTSAGSYQVALVVTDNLNANSLAVTKSIIVTAPAAMTGTLTSSASACTIAAGASSCNVSLSWSVATPETTPTQVTSSYPSAGYVVASGHIGGPFTVPIPLPQGARTFFLYNNAKELAARTVSASCAAGTTWNGSICQGTSTTLADLVPQSISVSPSPATAGGAVTVSYVVANTGGTAALASQTKIQIKNAANVLLTQSMFTTSSVSANSSISEARSMSLMGAVAGTYYVYIILDVSSVVPQSNVTNDVSTGTSFTVK